MDWGVLQWNSAGCVAMSFFSNQVQSTSTSTPVLGPRLGIPRKSRGRRICNDNEIIHVCTKKSQILLISRAK